MVLLATTRGLVASHGAKFPASVTAQCTHPANLRRLENSGALVANVRPPITSFAVQRTQTPLAHFGRDTTGVDRPGDRKPRRTLATPEFPAAEGSPTRYVECDRPSQTIAITHRRRSAESSGHASISCSRSVAGSKCSAFAALSPTSALFSEEFASFRVLPRPLKFFRGF